MTFYLAQWLENNENTFGELRNSPEECYNDLVNKGYDIFRLSKKEQFPSYCEVHNIGVAIIKV